MTIADTVPYASVAEANDYFDYTNNHLYCDEWWASNLGAYAMYTANMASDINGRLTFTAKNVGKSGNLVSVQIISGGGAGTVTFAVTGNFIAITRSTTTTAATIAAAVLASGPCMALLSACIALGTGASIPATEARKFLYGGIEPDGNLFGMQLPSLCLATRRIDNLRLAGKKAVSTQVNQFPRIYTKPDGSTYTQTAVPEDVKQACCEEALAILKYGNTVRYKLKTEGVHSYSDSGLNEVFNDKEIPQLLSPDAERIMKQYMGKSYNIRR